MKHIYIYLFFVAFILKGYSQTNLNLITATIQSSANVATVTFTPTAALPVGQFIGAINLYVKTPQVDFATTNINISTTYGLSLIGDWEEGADHWWYYQGQPSTPTANWPSGVGQTIATFTVTGTNTITLQNYSSGPIGNFWPGPAATIGDNNLVSWPVNQFAPLPIDIKTFSATKDGDRNARLDWSTSLEINSAHFGIERSVDGTSWEGISKVAAAGNSNTEQFYTYTDRDLPLNRSKDQIFYYRLQLVDLDGKYKYSDIRGVNFGKENTNKVISLYPNPAVQMVNLDLSGMDLESGAIHLRVTDMQGRNMIDKTILGNGIEPIEVTQLPAGTYNVAVSQGANLYQKQFIKIE